MLCRRPGYLISAAGLRSVPVERGGAYSRSGAHSRVVRLADFLRQAGLVEEREEEKVGVMEEDMTAAADGTEEEGQEEDAAAEGAAGGSAAASWEEVGYLAQYRLLEHVSRLAHDLLPPPLLRGPEPGQGADPGADGLSGARSAGGSEPHAGTGGTEAAELAAVSLNGAQSVTATSKGYRGSERTACCGGSKRAESSGSQGAESSGGRSERTPSSGGSEVHADHDPHSAACPEPHAGHCHQRHTGSSESERANWHPLASEGSESDAAYWHRSLPLPWQVSTLALASTLAAAGMLASPFALVMAGVGAASLSFQESNVLYVRACARVFALMCVCVCVCEAGGSSAGERMGGAGGHNLAPPSRPRR